MSSKITLRSKRSVVTAAAWAVLLTPVFASASQVTLRATLSGPEVSGDPDGRGEATITVNSETNQIEMQINYSNIAAPTAVHIRDGATGLDGGIAATFFIDSAGQGRLVATGSARPDHLARIVSSPEQYYLVIFNDEHVVGALRGQLTR